MVDPGRGRGVGNVTAYFAILDLFRMVGAVLVERKLGGRLGGGLREDWVDGFVNVPTMYIFLYVS